MHRLLLVAALVVPGALFAAAAWQNHADVLKAGRDGIERTAAVMQEHARKVFEMAELAIGQVDERIDGESWDGIEAPSVSDFLRRMKAPMDQLLSIWIADENGLLRNGTGVWTPGLRIPGHGFFKSPQIEDRYTEISPVFQGYTGESEAFSIIRRRTVPDGSFAGTIHVAVNPNYFTQFYAEAAPPVPHMAMLVRADGTVLAREPAGGPAQLPTDSVSLRLILAGGTGNTVAVDRGANGEVLQEAVRRVGTYPVFVVLAVRQRDLLAPWYRNMLAYGAVTFCAALTLLLVSGLALRRAQAEEDALGALRDEIRQRQAAEEQLRHTQRMEAVGQLTGGVAHDFNNLLMAIQGNLELIARAADAPAGRDATARAQIARMAASAILAVQRGAGLTKSLLAFSRRQAMRPQPLDANQAVGEFMPLLKQAAGKAVTVVFEPTPDLPPCLADKGELETALLNLVNNARDAMPGGGTLIVQTALTELDAAALRNNAEAVPGQFVSLSVTDNGGGMAAEVASRAAEPFFTTKEVGQGTGLGLSQVFGLVRQLGGHMEIETAPGAGTAVTLCLPVVAPGHNSAANPGLDEVMNLGTA